MPTVTTSPAPGGGSQPWKRVQVEVAYTDLDEDGRAPLYELAEGETIDHIGWVVTEQFDDPGSGGDILDTNLSSILSLALQLDYAPPMTTYRQGSQATILTNAPQSSWKSAPGVNIEGGPGGESFSFAVIDYAGTGTTGSIRIDLYIWQAE